MNIGVAYDNGQIAQNLGGCRTFLVVTTEGHHHFCHILQL